MDRAIIEVLNSAALVCIAAIIILLSYNIYFYYAYNYDNIVFDQIYNKIRNTIQKIYINVLKYGESDNIILILNVYVYIKGNGSHYLLLSYRGISKMLNSQLNVIADINSNILLFQYSNGILYITKASPLYIPPIIMR